MDTQQPSPLEDAAYKQEDGMISFWDHPHFRTIERSAETSFVNADSVGVQFHKQFGSFKEYSLLQIVAKLECARVDDIVAVAKSYGYSVTMTRVALEKLAKAGFVQKIQTIVGADYNAPINQSKMSRLVYTLTYPSWIMIRNHFPALKSQNPFAFWNHDATRGYNDPFMTIKRYTQLTHLFRVLWETGRLRNWEWRKVLYQQDETKSPKEGPIAIADLDIAPLEELKKNMEMKIQARYENDMSEDSTFEDNFSATNRTIQLAFGISQNYNKRIFIDFWTRVGNIDRIYKQCGYLPVDKFNNYKEQAQAQPLLLWFVSCKEMMDAIIAASAKKDNFSLEALKIPFAFVVGEWITEEDGASKAIVRYNPRKKKFERVEMAFFKPDPDRKLYNKLVERIETNYFTKKRAISDSAYNEISEEMIEQMLKEDELSKQDKERLKYSFSQLDVWS